MNFGRFLISNTARDCSKIFYRNFNKRTQKFEYNKLVKVNKRANRKPRLDLILKEDVPNLGVAGQPVQVKRGYGRNYLILNRLAVYATEENKEKYLASQTVQGGTGSLVADPKILPFFETAALKIPVEEEGGPWEITKHDISTQCRKKLSVVVPIHCVEMSKPITSCGDHVVRIVVNENVTTQLKCSVVAI
jgi:large subunit ribosomal protein L9